MKRLPMALPSVLREVDVASHRRVWCRQYDACLGEAIEGKWPSFSCAMCPVQDEVSVEERKATALAYAAQRMASNAKEAQALAGGRTRDEKRQQQARAYAAWRARQKKGSTPIQTAAPFGPCTDSTIRHPKAGKAPSRR